jgi:hypothetical protein
MALTLFLIPKEHKFARRETVLHNMLAAGAEKLLFSDGIKKLVHRCMKLL